EIVSDFWSVARVGIASTLGLIGVVSLPRPFIFRFNFDDPHPPPWIRVKLSCAIGDGLYPHPQWRRLARLWESYYPVADLDDESDLLAKLLTFWAMRSTLDSSAYCAAIPRSQVRALAT